MCICVYFLHNACKCVYFMASHNLGILPPESSLVLDELRARGIHAQLIETEDFTRRLASLYIIVFVTHRNRGLY
jgi:hypothetical protein